MRNRQGVESADPLARWTRLSVLGLVVDKPDRIMHGMELGAAGMHNQLRQWAQEGFMDQLLTLLSKAGFDLFLTSDHGNVEAAGIGRPGEGATADVRGQRVRVFPDNVHRMSVARARSCAPLLALCLINTRAPMTKSARSSRLGLIEAPFQDPLLQASSTDH